MDNRATIGEELGKPKSARNRGGIGERKKLSAIGEQLGNEKHASYRGTFGKDIYSMNRAAIGLLIEI